MKKLLSSLLTTAILLSSAWTAVPAGAYPDARQLDSAEKTVTRESGTSSNQGTVRITAAPGDDITVYFYLRQCNKAAGFLSELTYRSANLSYIDYDQYYTDTFINQVNDSKMMLSVLLEPGGTSITDDTAIIALKFRANSDITADDVCVTYTIKEFYNTDMFELDYESVIVKAVNANGDTDTEEGPHIHSPIIHEAKSPTCTEPGWGEWAECKVCGEIITPKIEVPAKGHTEVKDPAVEATCTKEGKTEGSHCSTCSAVLKAQKKVPKKDHNYVNGVCTMCGKKQGEQSIDSDKYTDTDTDGGGNDDPSGGLYGDVSGDGKITSKDALMILRSAIKLLKFTDAQTKLADVNNDGRANTTDALLVQRYSIGLKSGSSRVGQKYK